MNKPYSLRQATEQDLGAVTELFRQTILQVNARDYNASQRAAWSAGAENRSRWADRIQQQYFLLALDGERLAGFASITPQGYLDTMYVHHEYQHRGAGRQLYEALETYAIGNKVAEIISDVSITARPFFERMGFDVRLTQDVPLRGLLLRNYRMVKYLGA